jgi:hypothetical protein
MHHVRFIDPPKPDLRSDDPDAPNYEVTFWERYAEPAEVPEHERAFKAEVWQVADANVKEIIAWADDNVGDHRTYQIKVAVLDTDTVSNLVTLFGDNPVRGRVGARAMDRRVRG